MLFQITEKKFKWGWDWAILKVLLSYSHANKPTASLLGMDDVAVFYDFEKWPLLINY